MEQQQPVGSVIQRMNVARRYRSRKLERAIEPIDKSRDAFREKERPYGSEHYRRTGQPKRSFMSTWAAQSLGSC